MRTTMTHPTRPRRGIALATVIFALTILSAIAVAAVFLSMQEQRMGEGGRRVQKSFGLAEYGAVETVRSWNPATNNTKRLFPLDTVAIARTVAPSGTGEYAGAMYRLTNQLYLIDVTGNDAVSLAGRAPVNGARQRVGLLARVVPLQVDAAAALTVGGPVTFGGGNVFVNGTDNVPAGWTTCAAASTAVAGVRAKAAGDVGSSQGQVTGSPNVLVTPSMDSTTFTNFGTATYAQLAQLATIQLGSGTYAPAPQVAGTTCVNSNLNWGDGSAPTSVCGGRLPVVHITGDATITSGQGQGILLVDGNLTFSGTFTFYGLIITKGSLRTVAGGSPTVYGALLAQSMNLSTTSFAGDANFRYSTCALQRVRDAAGSPAAMRSRGWTRLM